MSDKHDWQALSVELAMTAKKNLDAKDDEITRLQSEVERLRWRCENAETESERVRQANLDVMVHFDDMKTTKEMLEAELDSALARVADAIGSLETVSGKAELGASVVRAERTEAMSHVAEGFDVIKEYAQSEATRLRQQADRMEADMGEDHG